MIEFPKTKEHASENTQNHQKKRERPKIPSGILQEVYRGNIYEFYNSWGDRLWGKLALVIGADDRCSDRFISILIISQYRGCNRDVVPVRVKGLEYYAHCGLVTTCKRGQLGKMVAKAEPIVMERIDGKIPLELGLAPAARQDYETLYHETVELLEGVKND